MGLDIMVTLFAQFSNDNYYYVIGTPPGNRCHIGLAPPLFSISHLLKIDNETNKPTDFQHQY